MANPINKTIYTLKVNDYAPRIRELTYPLIKRYAEKIGAEFVEITERKWPEWPITIEKFQVAELAKERHDDWSIFIDADTLVNPEFLDPTMLMAKDTVAHNGKDVAGVRWASDEYFMRDRRWFSSCTWLVIASDWTVEDLWMRPTLTPEEAFKRINITIGEHNSGQCHREHLIDDYTLSRNIARFGLKATTILELYGPLGWKNPDGRPFNPHLWHLYSISEEAKLSRMLDVLSTPNGMVLIDEATKQPRDIGWGLMDPGMANDLRKKWGIR